MKAKSNRLILVLVLFFVVLGAVFIPWAIKGQQDYADAQYLSNVDKQTLLHEGIAQYNSTVKSEMDALEHILASYRFGKSEYYVIERLYDEAGRKRQAAYVAEVTYRGGKYYWGKAAGDIGLDVGSANPFASPITYAPYFNALVPLAEDELMLAIGKVYDPAYVPRTESGTIPLNKDGVFVLFYPASDPVEIFIGDTLLFSGEEIFLNAPEAREVYPAMRSAQMIVQAISLACAVMSLIPLVILGRKTEERRKFLLWLMSVNAGILTITLIGFIASMHRVTAYRLSGNGLYGGLVAATFVVALLACVGAMILYNTSRTFQHERVG